MRRILDFFLDTLFPKSTYCSICEQPSNEIVCETCMASLEYLEGVVCLKCGKQLNENYFDVECPDCKQSTHIFDKAYSCFSNDGMGKDLIHKFKYEGAAELSEILARLMADKVKSEGIKANAIVPVPIHQKKLEARGFNQATLVAERMGERLHLPVIDCLVRNKETKEQYNLSREERFSNVYNAFSIKMLYNISKHSIILLIDDIYTTGSTVDECSKVLKAAGAKNVYVITAATGSNT